MFPGATYMVNKD